jgi:hypothetical protein
LPESSETTPKPSKAFEEFNSPPLRMPHSKEPDPNDDRIEMLENEKRY